MIELPRLHWDALQVHDKVAGWKPVGAVDIKERSKHSVYCTSRFVLKDDAARLASALERVVNSETADGDERRSSA